MFCTFTSGKSFLLEILEECLMVLNISLLIRRYNLQNLCVGVGTAVAELVEALRYKSEGRGFDSRWCHWNFSLT